MRVGEVFNVGAPNEIAMNALAELVLDRSGSSSRIVHIPYEEAYAEGFEDVERRIPDIGKIGRVVGWQPKLDLDRIVTDVIASDRRALETRRLPHTERAVSDLEYAVLYGAAFLVPLASVLLLTPLAARLATRLGVIDHPGGHKTHLEATPYLGGAAVAVGSDRGRVRRRVDHAPDRDHRRMRARGVRSRPPR